MFRHNIPEGGEFPQKWICWGDITNGIDVVGNYFQLRFPSYKMVFDLPRNQPVMGQLTFCKVSTKINRFTWADERYLFDYFPVH